MAKQTFYKLSNTDNVASYAKGQGDWANKGVNSVLYVITKSNYNIYSSAEAAKGKSQNSKDENAMYTISIGTALRVTGRANIGNSIILQVNCNGKNGYIYVGNVKETNSGSSGNTRTWKWDGNPNVFLALKSNNTYSLSGYGLGTNDVGSSGEYSVFDSSRILYTGGNSSSAEDSTDTTTSASIASTTASADSASTGEINVTYEFAVTGTKYSYKMEEYLAYLEDQNNSNQDLTGSENGINYSGLKYVFGMPYQFLPTTDCRVGAGYDDEIEKAGYEFSEKIIARLHLLYITPGNTAFMGSSSSSVAKENARTTLLGSLESTLFGDDTTESSLETMLGEYNGKLYTITPAYTEYFKYVNPLCRSGAIFLDIGGTSFNSTSIVENSALETSSACFANMNWGVNEGVAYDIWLEEEDTLEGAEDDEEAEDVSENSDTTTDQEETESTRAKFERDYSDFFVQYEDASTSEFSKFFKNLYYGNSIAFYINSDSSFQDSFSNETTESSLSTTINALSDKARELQFLLGTASTAVGEAFDKVDGTLSQIKSQISSIVDTVAGGNSIFTTIANSVKTIVSGGRMLFPQIWSNSGFSKSYNIAIKLVSPNTDKVSWYLNIYVPLCHLMALVLPRSEYVNSYTTPFLIKAFYKGMFNIDMGIITEMSFTKGKEGSWTKDGLPTVVDVSFSIQDLYSAMGMTSTANMFKGTTLQNVSEMDYIANLCGININEPDPFRMVNLWCAFNISNKVYDFIPNLSLGLQQYVSNGIINAYNNFWS
jgi:hypothetical protein